MKKRLVTIFALMMMSVFGGITGFAAEKDPIEYKSASYGLTEEGKASFIEDINKGLESIAHDPVAIKEYLLKNDFVPAEEKITVQPYHHSAVTFSIDAFRNTYNGLYTISGNWKFESGKIDQADSSEDVVALSLWKTDYTSPSGIVWNSYPTRIYVYDSLKNLKVNTSSHYNSAANGFVWKYQDAYILNGNGYTGQTGTVVMWANSVPTGTLYAGMNYLHTYSKIGTLQSATVSGSTKEGIKLEATFSGGSTGTQTFKDQITISSWPGRYVE